MTSIRNLPLAVRLGGAFGALCVALAIIAFSGIHSMDGVRDDAETLAHEHLEAAEALGADPRARQGQRQPDLAAPVRRRRRPRRPRTRSPRSSRPTSRPTRSTRPQLEKLFAGTEAEPEYAAYAKARGALVDAMQRAISASRDGDASRNAEERDGSRAIFIDEVLKADDERREGRPTRSSRRPTGSPSTPTTEAVATASSGTRLIIIVALLGDRSPPRPSPPGSPARSCARSRASASA